MGWQNTGLARKFEFLKNVSRKQARMDRCLHFKRCLRCLLYTLESLQLKSVALRAAVLAWSYL